MMIGKTMAAIAIAATVVLTLPAQSDGAAAEEVTVKQNGTALRRAPAPGATAEWRVNSGFALTVVDEQDGWLRVESGSLPDDTPALWVRADQVAARGAGAEASSSSVGTDSADAAEKPTGYRVELTGTPDMKFKLRCWSVDDGHVSYRPHANRLPRSYDYPGDSVSCIVYKKQRRGEVRIDLVAIYPTKERLIGSASSDDYPTSIFARSQGPWGVEAVATARGGDLVLAPATSP